jgi:hypothetical protein
MAENDSRHPMDLSHRPGRGGITINDRGDQGTIGFWPEKFDTGNNKTGWTGALRAQFGEAVRIAQRHHTQNEAVRLARATGKPAAIPEPHVRQSLARAEQKKLAAIEHRVFLVADEAFIKRMSLKPYDYPATDMVGALNRQELRTMLRGMNAEQKAAALKKHEYRRAAVEQPAELSGIPQSQRDTMYEAELASKFPAEVAGIAEANEAAEIVRTALKTANLAVANELLASGTTVAEPAEPPPPAKAWA